MARGDPERRSSWRFGELTPDDFEALVFRLAWVEDRSVVRMRAPDGGLDVVRPDDERPGKAIAGWQAKRHTRDIDWRDCEASLDRCVQIWEPTAVTFVFPKNLTRGEHEAFHQRLAARHEGVTVDYWAAAALEGRLESESGKRVAAKFFRAHDEGELAQRMLRAGNASATAADFLQADFGIAEAIAEQDLDYDWEIRRRAAAQPPPAMDSRAMLRLTFEAGDHRLYADLLPAHVGAPVRLLIETDATSAGAQARRWLDELRQRGGRLRLREGVRIRVSDVPPPFGELLADAVDGEILVRSSSEPPPYFATIVAEGSSGPVALDVDLVATEPAEEWDAKLEGRYGGLRISLAFRWHVQEGRGESNLHFEYSPSGGSSRGGGRGLAMAARGARTRRCRSPRSTRGQAENAPGNNAAGRVGHTAHPLGGPQGALRHRASGRSASAADSSASLSRCGASRAGRGIRA